VTYRVEKHATLQRMPLRQPLVLGGLAAANIGVAFLYQWYVLVTIGPGTATDALFAGMTVPQLVLAVVSMSLTHVLVPLLGGEAPDRSRHDAWAFFTLVGSAFAALAALLGITASYWVPVTVPGFSKDAQDLTVYLTRVQLVGMVFTALTGVQSAVYHARQSFVWVEMSPLLTGAAGLGALVFLIPAYGVEAVAWVTTIRLAAQVVLLMPGMGAWIRPDLTSQSVRTVWKRIKPLLLGTAYYKTDPLVDRFLLSSAASGSLSLFYFAQQLYGAGTAVLGRAIVTPLVPTLSVLHKARNRTAFRAAYHRALWQVGIPAIAGLVVVALFGKPLLSLIVGHGTVTSANIDQLWRIMLGLGGAFMGGAMASVTASSFYARTDTRYPTRLGIITYTLYIPIKVASYQLGGVMALAISASAFYLVNMIMQYIRLERGE